MKEKLLSADHVMSLFGLTEPVSVGTVPASVIVGAPDSGSKIEEIPSSGELYRKVMDESKASGKPWEAKVNLGYHGDEEGE